MREQRRLAAIVAADVVGYSRLMGRDESGTLAALKALRREVVDPRIAAHGGRIVKTTGDGLLLEFQSVVDAVRCVVEVQSEMATRNTDVPEDHRIAFRVGINLGDIIIDGDDIFGDGVNVAARLEALCEPGGIAVSGNVHEQVQDRPDCDFADGGRHEVKNIARPVQVWRWALAETTAATGLARTVEQPLTLPDKPSIAVLPFDNMSGDPEQDFFADGIAEDLITTLSRFRSLFVIARNSSFTYKGQAVDVTRVARELGVRYVVEGSVRKAGNRVRITAQLIDARTGNHLWADRFDGTLDDVFELQDRITEQIVIAVEPEIEAAERARARLKPPQSLDAWETYQRGLGEFYRFTREDNARAIELFRKATTLDPNFAAAWGVLGWALSISHILLFAQGEKEALAGARAAAERAIALDTDEPSAHLTLGRLLALAGQHEMAIEEMRTAVRANPNHARGYYRLGWVYWYGLSDSATALEHYETALRLSPRDPMRFLILMVKGAALRTAGRLIEAIEVGRESCRHQGAGYLPRLHFAITLAKAGRIEEARALLQEVRELEPGLCLASVRAARREMHPDMLADTIEGLARIGLPETAEEPIRS